jgi:ankyrin repeat protein
MKAALAGNVPSMFDQIRSGADVNALEDGASALAFAAFANRSEAVEFLLDAGAHRKNLTARNDASGICRDR